MPRIADDILMGGVRVFIQRDNDASPYELGWLQGEIQVEEQATSQTIKESEGATVLVTAQDKEVHLTFSLLECNLETLLKLNPSAVEIGGTGDTESDGKGFAVGTFQSDDTYKVEVWHKKRSGTYRCTRFFKGKISGNFTTFLINQDSESPIDVDLIAIADESKGTNRNIYEVFECAAAKAPGGGW